MNKIMEVNVEEMEMVAAPKAIEYAAQPYDYHWYDRFGNLH